MIKKMFLTFLLFFTIGNGQLAKVSVALPSVTNYNVHPGGIQRWDEKNPPNVTSILSSKFDDGAIVYLRTWKADNEGDLQPNVAHTFIVGFQKPGQNPVEFSFERKWFVPSPDPQALVEVSKHHIAILGSSSFCHLSWGENAPFWPTAQELKVSQVEIGETLSRFSRIYPVGKSYFIGSESFGNVTLAELDSTLKVIRQKTLKVPDEFRNDSFFSNVSSMESVVVPRVNGAFVYFSYGSSLSKGKGRTAILEIDNKWEKITWTETLNEQDACRVTNAIPLPNGKIAMAGFSGTYDRENGPFLRNGSHWVKALGEAGVISRIDSWDDAHPGFIVPSLSLNPVSDELAIGGNNNLHIFSADGQTRKQVLPLNLPGRWFVHDHVSAAIGNASGFALADDVYDGRFRGSRLTWVVSANQLLGKPD